MRSRKRELRSGSLSYRNDIRIRGSLARRMDSVSSSEETQEKNKEVKKRANIKVEKTKRNEIRDRHEGIRNNRNVVARQMNLAGFLLMALSVLCLLYVSNLYLSTESMFKKSMAEIESLEKELQGKIDENEAIKSAIKRNVDIEYIRATAINELGMVYAEKNQIIKYDTYEREYVSQYENIPSR